MPFSFPPCPVCGGAQAFFNGSDNTPASIRIAGNFWSKGVTLGALICLSCGHTEIRPHPGDMHKLRAIAEKRGLLPD